MSDLNAEIDAALSSDASIPRDDVVRWIAAADDVLTLAKLYQLTEERYYSIEPDLGQHETCSLIQRHLLECMRLNLTDRDDVQGRWEAAQSLQAWFCHLMERGDAAPVLKQAAQGVTDLFLSGNDDLRTAIEQGFLEHALETAALRPYFEHWSADDRLSPAWRRAMRWGEAHPDYMWGMMKRIRDIQS